MKPQIDFKHVLGELSVNRSDSCEVIRELISNSHDAGAKNIRYAAIDSLKAFVFFDDGVGLNRLDKSSNNITPYEAFFSIGKSTKIQGRSIGYKCQGSKLCFAANRVLIISKTKQDESWFFKIIENPRQNLSFDMDITPKDTNKPWDELINFFGGGGSDVVDVIGGYNKEFFKGKFNQGFLIAVQGLDVENFTKHLVVSDKIEDSYIYNYIRFYTKHGDTRLIKKEQGFLEKHVAQVLAKDIVETNLYLFNGNDYVQIPFGFPYLNVNSEEVKSPDKITRLRDGRFSSGYAKKIIHGSRSYSLILAIDGNRRALDEYKSLSRKNGTNSGVPLSDQRGVFISVSGVKVCKFNDIFLKSELNDYSILHETNSSSHFILIMDGQFDLITNRNGISRSAAGVFENTEFLDKIKSFLDEAKRNLLVFSQLIARLKKEQHDVNLERQMEILNESKNGIGQRERMSIDGKTYLSPLQGEEYLVGILYATLYYKIPIDSKYSKYWNRVLTFSTQGIDSIATVKGSFAVNDLVAIEYKYDFSSDNQFNHPLSIVDKIIAWDVNIGSAHTVSDDYNCFGVIDEVEDGIYRIYDIQSKNNEQYSNEILVVCLKKLIKATFGEDVKFIMPSPPKTTKSSKVKNLTLFN